MKSMDSQADVVAQDAVDVLRQHGKGALALELSAKLGEVVRAVQTTQKVGTVTLALKFKPYKRGAIEVTHEVKANVPTEPATPSMYFSDEEGRLHRDDPAQMTFKEGGE